MPKIIDIKIVTGRRAEKIENETRMNDALRKCATLLYTRWKHQYNSVQTIEWWANNINQDKHYKELYTETIGASDKLLLKEAGVILPEIKPEMSIEQKMLDLIKDGWEPQGELILSDKDFFQKMVKYEVTPTADLLGN